MSTTIDEKVVEMRFDNQNFERNARTSMSTLAKLKQSLKLDGAAKGFDEIDSAAKKINMPALGSAVEAVNSKFSALEVMGVTALVNITNQAVNAAKHIAAMFTIEPVKTGFNEYELKMGSIQTIMASTGESLETVNKYLDELNTYSDKTIYSFADMTSNIGKFTNAGVKLEDAVLAIKGVSNEAAVSGANANEASRAMYNFSQALSSGYVKLIDWKSIENANMATVEFKQQLLESAVACGTLTKTADGMYKTSKRTVSSTLNFNDSLQDQWMTTEVLTRTLAQYATDVRDMTSAEKEAYEEKLRGQGYTEEQIKNIEELGKKAYDSAQDVKTFTMMMDTLKEAAQSGWSRTWELLIGDFEQAKTLWTDLSKVLGGFIDKMSDTRNAVLESALGKSFTDMIDGLKNITDPIKNSADSIKEVVDSVKDYAVVVDEIMGGKWGNGQSRWDKLTEAGYDWAHAQNLINEKLGDSTRHATDYKEAQKGVADAQNKTTKSTDKLTEAEKKQIIQMAAMLDDSEKSKQLTKEQVDALSELVSTADKLGMSVEDLVNNIDEIDGRWLLFNSLKNAGNGLLEVLRAVGKAWRQAFYGDASDDEILKRRSERLFDLIAALHKLSTKLIVSEQTSAKLTRTFKGLFAILDLISTVTGGTLKLAFRILTEILKLFDMDILDLTANIGDMAVKFRDWVDSVLDFSSVFDRISPSIKGFVEKIKEWLNGFKGIDNIPKYILESLKSGFAAVGRFVKAKFKEFSENIVDDAMEFMLTGFTSVPSNIIEGFEKGFVWGILSVIKYVRTFCNNIITTIKDIFQIHSPSVVMFEIGQNVVQGFINGISVMISKTIEVVKRLFTGSKEAIEDTNIGEAFDKILDGAKKFGAKIIETFKGIDLGKVFAAALGIGILLTAKKALDVLEMFAKPLAGFGDLLSGIGNAFAGWGANLKASALKKKAQALLLISASVLLLVSALLPLVDIPVEKLLKAGACLAVITGALISIGFAIGKIGSVDWQMSTNILAIAVSFGILAYSAKKLSEIPVENVDTTLKIIGALIGGLAAIYMAFGIFINADKASNMDKAGMMIFKMAAALLTITTIIKIVSGFKYSEIQKGLIFIGGVMALFAAITAVSKLAGPWADYAGAMMWRMATSMLIMVAVVKIASGFTNDEIKQGLKFVAGVEALFVAVIAVSKLAGENGKIAGKMLLKMAISMLIMVGIIKLVSQMSMDDVKKGFVVVASMELLLGAIVALSHLAGANAGKAGLMLVAMAFAISILVGILFVVSKMNPDEVYRALPIIGALELMFMGLIAVTKFAKETNGLNKTLVLMLITIGLLVACVAGLSFIDSKDLTTATAAISSIIGMFALLMLATKFTKNTADMRMSLVTLLAVTVGLAGIIAALSNINTGSALKAAGALSIVMLSFSTSIVILSKADRVLKTAVNAIGPMFLVTVGLAAILGVLATLKVEASINNALAIGILLNSFAASISVLSKADAVSKEALNSVYSMLAVTAGLAVILGVMGALKVEASLNNAIVLGVMLNEFAASIVVLSKAGNVSLNALTALPAMIGVTAGLAVILGIMAALNVEASIQTAISLGILVNALAASMVILSYVGYISKDVVATAVLMGLVVAELAVSLGILAKMNIQEAIPYAIALSTLLLTMTVVTGILGAMSPLISAAIPAVLALGVVIAELALVLAAIGGLAQIPGLEWLISEGGDFLQTIGTAIGKFIGGIVGGIAAGAESALPSIALSLSLFMMGIQPFILGAKSINGDAVKGVTFLTAAILELAVASFVSAIVTLGGLGLIGLASTLNTFAKIIKPFCDQISTIKPESVTAAKTIADMILELCAAELIQRITSFVGGTANIADFSDQLQAFGNAVVAFDQTLKSNGGIDANSVQAAAAAGSMIAELQSKLYGAGGLKQAIFGEKDLGTFSDQLVAFGEAMVKFSNTITSNGGINAEAIEGASKAGSLMAELALSLPKTGGIWQNVAGEQDIGLFGLKCVAFGAAMKLFSDTISGDNAIDAGAIEAASKAGELMSKLQDTLPKTGGVWQSIAGEQDIAEFGRKCAAFGQAMVGFPTINISDETITSISKAGMAVSEIQKILPREDGFLQNIVGQKDIEGFATACKTFSQALTNLKYITINDENVESITRTGVAMRLLQQILPREDGLLQKIAGQKDIEAFANGCLAFSKALRNLSSFSISEDTVASISNTGNMLVELQKSIPGSRWLDGKVNLEEFAGQISKFKGALDKIATFSISADTLAMITVTGTMLIALQKAIPSSTWLDGKVELDEFGSNISKFAKGIKKLSEFSMTEDAIVSVDNTGRMLIALQKAIPESTWLDGKVELDEFGKKIKSFGGYLASYSEKVSEIDFGAVSASLTQSRKFIYLANSLVDLDLSGIENFKIKNLGSALEGYYNKINEIDFSVVSSSISQVMRLKSLVQSLAGLDNSGIESFTIKSIGSKLNGYYEAVSGIDTGVVSTSISNANQLKIFISSLAGLDTSGVGSFEAAVNALGTVDIGKIVSAFEGASTVLYSAGAKIITSVATGMKSRLGYLLTTSTAMVTQLRNTINGASASFKSAGVVLMTQFSLGMSSQKDRVSTSASGVVSSAVNTVNNHYINFYSAGKYLVEGFASGISANTFRAEAQAAAMAEAAKRAAEKALGINSPSKVFYKIGDYTGQGFVNALVDYGKTAYDSASSMADYARKGMTSAIGRIQNLINSDMDSQPTIRPVLDLSDVQSGVAYMNGLLPSSASIGVMSNLNSISSMMNRNNQNGEYGEVVSAIEGLRKDLGNTGDTYIIDGVTYDDGSAVSSAMQTIVRAAKIERRV